jgi:hypothetical protein
MSDTAVIEIFESGNKSSNPLYEYISKEFTYIGKDLKRPGVKLFQLWEEYKGHQEQGFSYSRFCHHYKMWKRNAVSLIFEYLIQIGLGFIKLCNTSFKSALAASGGKVYLDGWRQSIYRFYK